MKLTKIEILIIEYLTYVLFRRAGMKHRLDDSIIKRDRIIAIEKMGLYPLTRDQMITIGPDKYQMMYVKHSNRPRINITRNNFIILLEYLREETIAITWIMTNVFCSINDYANNFGIIQKNICHGDRVVLNFDDRCHQYDCIQNTVDFIEKAIPIFNHVQINIIYVCNPVGNDVLDFLVEKTKATIYYSKEKGIFNLYQPDLCESFVED